MTFSGGVYGTYVIEHGNGDRFIAPGSILVGEAQGAIKLTASMSDRIVRGRVFMYRQGVSGRGILRDKATGVRREWSGWYWFDDLDLGSTIYSAGGVFTGNVAAVSGRSIYEAANSSITESSGAWGGKFSNVAGSGSDPRGAAGTVGVDFNLASGREEVSSPTGAPTKAKRTALLPSPLPPIPLSRRSKPSSVMRMRC